MTSAIPKKCWIAQRSPVQLVSQSLSSFSSEKNVRRHINVNNSSGLRAHHSVLTSSANNWLCFLSLKCLYSICETRNIN